MVDMCAVREVRNCCSPSRRAVWQTPTEGPQTAQGCKSLLSRVLNSFIHSFMAGKEKSKPWAPEPQHARRGYCARHAGAHICASGGSSPASAAAGKLQATATHTKLQQLLAARAGAAPSPLTASVRDAVAVVVVAAMVAEAAASPMGCTGGMVAAAPGALAVKLVVVGGMPAC